MLELKSIKRIEAQDQLAASTRLWEMTTSKLARLEVKIPPYKNGVQPVLMQPVGKNGNRYTPKFLAAALGVWMISAGLGADLAYPSMAAIDINTHPNPFHLTIHEVALFSSIFAVGAAIGSPLCGLASDRYGRRHLLILITLPVVLSWMLVASSVNSYMIIASRFLTGFFSGCMENISPVYISEISPPGRHGLICSFIGVFRSSGYLFVFGMGQVLCWNWLAIACSAFTMVAVLFLFFMRESPRWLIANGCYEEALEALTFLRDPEQDDVLKEMDAIRECIDINKTIQDTRELVPKASFFQRVIIQQKTYRQLIMLGVLMIAEHFCGAYTLVVYSVEFSRMAEIDVSANVVNLASGFSGLLGGVLCSLIVDRSGRRPVLIVSCTIDCLLLSTLAIYAMYKPFFYSNYILRYVPMVCYMIVSFITRFGISTIPYVLNGEVFPLQHRGFFIGLVSVFSWALTFLATLIFPYQLEFLGESATFWSMAAFALLGAVFTWFMVPETKNKSLEEIEQYFKQSRKRTNKSPS